jgi:2-amino-4-hydroxy-6-hydroxymethyldihydropteridine diphosphokinase
MSKVYLGLGSNLGDREDALRRALSLLGLVMTVQAVSSLYETEPVGYTAQDTFLNAVVRGETSLAASDLLVKAKEIEQQVGRTPTVRWGPRVVDIDLLSYNDTVSDDSALTLPHPRLAERAFVLVPLSEIDPDWRHPLLAQTARALLARLEPIAGIRLYKQHWWP